MNEGRDETYDDLLISITNLSVMINNMTEIFVLVFMTSKGTTPAVKAEIEERLNKMRIEAAFKISQATKQIIELSKERSREAKAKATALVTEVANETAGMINELKESAEELVSKKVGQAFDRKGWALWKNIKRK